jgi:hypothetical protein
MNSRDIERNRHRREGGVELVREPSERESESRRVNGREEKEKEEDEKENLNEREEEGVGDRGGEKLQCLVWFGYATTGHGAASLATRQKQDLFG